MRNQIKKTASFVSAWSKVERKGYALSSWKTFQSREHFPKLLGTIIISGGIAGYYTKDYLYNSRMERQEKMYAAAWEANMLRKRRFSIKSDLSNEVDFTDVTAPSFVRTLTRRLTRVAMRGTNRTSVEDVTQM